ncbi:MAG: HAMP domain-containing sensor histidine kinase, partial [Ignavibacteria bacterium]|nr:HAMP domain-containing sensor histidine kinase [Ignavibacteria bacterium]
TSELNIANRKLLAEIEKEKEVEAKLEETLEKEIELNRLKSRFIATTSHEFRTPLTIILSSAELIQRNMHRLTEEKIAEYSIRIKNSVFYLTKLMEDIIILNKANSGKLKYEPRTINLREICDEVLEASLLYAKEDHKVFFDYHPEETEFTLDERLMKFILSNILCNAFKFSPDGGLVSFTIQNHEKELIFKIEDEGIGIPEEDKTFLFEPFQRSSNCEDIPGTGLGLSIAQKAAELQKGKISLVSKLNKGTVFEVRIPIE